MMAVRAAVVAMCVVVVGCSGVTGQSEEVRAFCLRAEDVDRYLNEGVSFGDVSDEDVIVAFEELTDAAPNEIFDDVDIVREAYTYAVDTGDQSVLSEPEVEDASSRFARYLDQQCGIG